MNNPLFWIIAGLTYFGGMLFLYGEAEPDYNRIVNAIYSAEGGGKANFPYGIKSIKVKNKIEARRICFNTVRNNYHRWVKAGRKGTFISFLASRYCPISDPDDKRGLNRNWQKNVLFYFHKNIKIVNLEYEARKRRRET